MSGRRGTSSERSSSYLAMSDEGPGTLVEQAEDLGRELDDLLEAVLPDASDVEVVSLENRYVIRPVASPTTGRGVPLYVQSERLATLEISFRCCLDSVARYLAVEQSSFVLRADLDRTPIIRFDYRRDMNVAPHAHIQVHAHRGALSHLLSRAGHPAPHDMSSLHIPVGGSRFRPCLEDLLQFLIVECHFDHIDGWEQAVEAGRERWRRRQVAAITRDVPTEAVRVLRELGYTVEPPGTQLSESVKALRRW